MRDLAWTRWSRGLRGSSLHDRELSLGIAIAFALDLREPVRCAQSLQPLLQRLRR